MKRGWKVFWIIVAIFTALGLICGGIALGLGVTLADLNDDFSVRESVIYTYDDTTNITEVSAEQYEFENITDLVISVGACEVIIRPSDIDYVQVDTSHLKYEALNLELSATVDDGTLIIRTMKNGNVWDVISAKNSNGGTLKIYLPENVKLSSAAFEFGACDVEVSGLAIDHMDLVMGAVDCEMEKMNLNSLHVEVGAGAFDYSGTISGDVDIECGAGEVDLSLSGKENEFNYDLSVGLGEVEIGEREYGGFAVDKTINNQADKNMVIECGAGSVSVDFR